MVLKERLQDKTGCAAQYTGWPCNTCFHAMDLGIDVDRLHDLWLSTLLLRGDYKKADIQQDDKTFNENIEELLILLGGHD